MTLALTKLSSAAIPAHSDGGGLTDSTCDQIAIGMPQVHDFIAEAMKQRAKGTYKCISAWSEVTSEPTAWVQCTIGGAYYAVQVLKNGANVRVHTPTDPNTAQHVRFASDTSTTLLNKFYLKEFKQIGGGQADLTVPARVQKISSQAVAEDDAADDESLYTGYVPETAEELAALPKLPELPEEALANLPSSWDVRKGLNCNAFARLTQGSCGSCWAWATAATYSVRA